MSETLYETDLAAWAITGANLLRRDLPLGPEYREQIAEELEGMAGNTRRELRSRCATLIMHLLTIRFQPERRTRSWDLTVDVQREELREIFAESPGLRRTLAERLDDVYASAKRRAEIETGLTTFPEKNPFTMDEILNG